MALPEQPGGLDFDRLGAHALRTLIERTADGIIVVDADGVVSYANPAANSLFGQQDLLGKAFGVPMVAGEKAEVELPGPAGIRTVELRSAPAELDGTPVFLVSLHDVTERQAAEDERERARGEAEAAARTRSALLNMVAHEFRTPLTVICGYLSMIADESLGPVPGDWRDVIEKVNDKAGELRTMIDEILMAARLEAGRLGSSREVMDLRDVVRHAVRRATGRGALLRAQIRIELPDDPAVASIDATQVGIVLDNLINNALTYSQGGEPWIEVAMRVEASKARVTVSDHGIGIPPEMQAAVFERFRRVTSTSAETKPGTGLGLAIARDLAQLNGGDLSLLESAPGKGSVFLLTLPISPS